MFSSLISDFILDKKNKILSRSIVLSLSMQDKFEKNSQSSIENTINLF
jgi:hypothetical protein